MIPSLFDEGPGCPCTGAGRPPMAQTIYVVQTFEMQRARLVPALREPATTAESARRRAEREAERKGGAIAIEMMIDEDTGAIDSSRVLSSFGKVPDDIEESMWLAL
jgi:hypothetical protein